MLGSLAVATPVAGQPVTNDTSAPVPGRVRCVSAPGQRFHCPADVSGGIALVRSSGEAPCLLGKTWGYDDEGVWVSDGCGGEFIVGESTRPPAPPSAPEAPPEPQEPKEPKEPKEESSPEYIPNLGFKLYEGEKGQIYVRLFSYARYLNQESLDPTYTDAFGNVKTVQRREDIQLNKFFLPFSGWFLSPKLRYYLYVWSSNPSQGDPAQVVGAGNLSYTFNRFFTFGAGITSLPSVRSTEGQFPYWLGVDDRLIADEFFRGSYTTGVWLKGEFADKWKYMAMLGNNLSTLGVSASQIDNHLDTTSLMLAWMPTTGEFGYLQTFGDYDWHEQLATRIAGHFTHSREDRQAQPGTNTIENSQIRLTDGSVIFTPELFGPGITVESVDYDMASLDAGLKYKGFSLEAEYYWRDLSEYAGPGTASLEEISDTGFQLQVSAMAVKDVLQVYAGTSEIYGDYGDGSELRFGVNWYPLASRGLRVNGEWLDLENCPVGYTAVPYAVGASGSVFHLNFEMNF
jgi:hypothetical protein